MRGTAGALDAYIKSEAYRRGVARAIADAPPPNVNPHGVACPCGSGDRMPCGCCIRTVGHRTSCPKGATT